MEHRTKRNHALDELVSEYETMVKKGTIGYLDERSFLALIDYYESEFSIDRAIEVSEHALEQFSYCVDFYVITARLFLHNKNVPLAKKFIEKASIIAPNDYEVMLLNIHINTALNNTEEALQQLSRCKKISTGMDKLDLYLVEASIYESMKDFHQMFKSLSKALELDPKNEGILQRVWRSVELSKNYDESIELHERILDQDAYNYHAWYNLGQAFACKGEYARAINATEYSYIINEDFEAGYLECADLCCQLQDYTRALKIYLEASDVFGLDEEVSVNIAICYIQLGQFKNAKKYLVESLKHELYNDELYYYLGLCFLNENKLTNAITSFQKAIKIEDRREEYYAELAKAYYLNGENAKAHHNFRKATEIGPEQEIYWIRHVQFLIALNKTVRAVEIMKEAEVHSVGVSLSYCQAALFMATERESEGLQLLEDTLKEDYKMHHVLFETNPTLLENSTVVSMVRYYAPIEVN